MSAVPAMTTATAFESSLSADALRFFQGKNEGGMGRWTYVLNNFWDQLILNQDAYYPNRADLLLMAENGERIADTLKECKVLCEIGPGSEETIKAKTVPFVRAMQQRGLEAYAAVDTDLESAASSSKLVKSLTKIEEVEQYSEDFFAGLDIRFKKKPKAIMILGSTIGNLPGIKGQDGKEELSKVFQRAAKNLEKGDYLVFSFDTERNEKALKYAYNGPYNENLCKSILTLIEQECAIQGHFEPAVWRHEAVFDPSVNQVAHIIFPEKDQDFTLDGVKIQVKAGQKFVMNNSYKFSTQEIAVALIAAGLDAEIITSPNNPMAMAIARKP